MANKKYLFILNPVSGKSNTSELIELVDQQAKKHVVKYKIYETTGNSDQRTIESLINDYKPDVLVAAGGDGTIKLAGEAIAGVDILLGILPTGSANGLAFELGIPLQIEKAFDILFNGKQKKLDAITVNGNDCFHLSDVGMNARIIKRYKEEGVRGFYGYARQFFKEFHKPGKFRYKLITPQKIKKGKAQMIVFANATSYGTGAVINPKGDTSDGSFEVVIVKPYPWWHIFWLIWALFTRRLNQTRSVKTIRTKRAELIVKEPQELQVDGEHLGKTNKVNAEIILGKVNLIVPG